MSTAAALAPALVLTPEQVNTYHNDGFLIVRGLYSGETMLEWKRVLHNVLADEREKAGKKRDEWDLSDSGVRVWNSQHIHPFLLEAMKDNHVGPILHQLLGPSVEFLSAKVVFKNSTTSFASPWHQDWFYWEGAPKMSVWIALDDAYPANGCLKLIPGSHKKVFPKFCAHGNAFVNRIEDKELEGLPVTVGEVKRGDAVFFSDLAVHSSFPNTVKADRFSMISTYRNAAVKDICGLNKDLWDKPLLLGGVSMNNGKAM